jgi:hypothetical protein
MIEKRRFGELHAPKHAQGVIRSGRERNSRGGGEIDGDEEACQSQ